MKLCQVFVVLLLLSCSTTALAAGPYIGTDAGISLVSHGGGIEQIFGASDALGFGWNANLGYEFEDYRVDAEYGYKWVSYVLASGKVSSYMLNGYRTFKNESGGLKPFVGGGLGVVRGEIEDEGVAADDSSPAFQFTFGADYKISRNVTGTFYYRYEKAFSDFSENGNNISYGSANLFGGFRYNF